MKLQIADQATPVTITGTIDKVFRPGWYLVKDSQKRTYRAASAVMYRKGEQVRIVGDQIVGTAGTVKDPAVYEV